MKKTISLVSALTVALATGTAKADFTFGTPTNLGPLVNKASHDEVPSISADGLTLYFNSNRSGGSGTFDIWMTARPTTSDPWGEPVNLGATVNGPDWDQAPCISPDGLTLYFTSTRSGGWDWDLWVTTRATTDGLWGTPVNLGPIVNSTMAEFGTTILPDGLSLIFASERAGGLGGDDLYMTSRASIADSWGAPVNLGSTVNSPANEGGPSISADGRILFFSGYAYGPYRPGGYGRADIWVTTRATISDTWGTPVNLGPPINTSHFDFFPNISADGSTLFFMSDRPGGYGNWDLWQAPILPVVDFNGDGIVDLKDFSRLAQYWGQNRRSVDMGPTPLGDGTVDIQDVAALAEYWLEDFRVIAHWKFDETAGGIARDSAGDKDGTLHGDPVWQPTGGKVAGALQLDGINDYVSTAFSLNPKDEPFSVFVWIKTDSAGQAIISQTDGTTGFGSAWLCTDPSHGRLMSRLMEVPFGPLESESVITDGHWHHIGLVYDLDATRRHLYVDGVEVAQDADFVGWIASDGGLYFGAAKDLDPASFFSGLIDDIRIYDRAIVP